jgi:glycosyltransferase involved in cell wall biosynthesis
MPDYQMYYPRVIIIGETFRLDGGGGITMANLFKDWPESNIGVVTDLIAHTNPKTKYKYYQLGNKEIKFPFPFSIFQTYFESGSYTFKDGNETGYSINRRPDKFRKIKKIIRPCFDILLERLGLYSFFYIVKLSELLKKWILDFKPDIIYIQPFHHRIMKFGNLLNDEFRIPYAIHIMDDSVKYLNKSLVLRGLIQRHIERDFLRLVINAKVNLCISEAMAEEYLKRYRKVFLPFRNPVELERWKIGGNQLEITNKLSLRIIYTGRIFPPTFRSFLDICRVVDALNRKNKNVNLEYTKDNTKSFLKRIKKLQGISYHPPVDDEEFPNFIQQYDIFLICINFDRETQKYLKFSMSTRASEGMISGVPILIYAPMNLALTKYFTENESGITVSERNLSKLEEAIIKLWNNGELRERLSKNAVKTALRDNDASIVRETFRKAMTIG